MYRRQNRKKYSGVTTLWYKQEKKLLKKEENENDGEMALIIVTIKCMLSLLLDEIQTLRLYISSLRYRGKAFYYTELTLKNK